VNARLKQWHVKDLLLELGNEKFRLISTDRHNNQIALYMVKRYNKLPIFTVVEQDLRVPVSVYKVQLVDRESGSL
jgi:hypothetical protein